MDSLTRRVQCTIPVRCGSFVIRNVAALGRRDSINSYPTFISRDCLRV